MISARVDLVVGRALRYTLVPLADRHLAAFDVLCVADFDDEVLGRAITRVEQGTSSRTGTAGRAAVHLLHDAHALSLLASA